MTIQHFSSDGVEIAFFDTGEGEPILLIHGFASNLVVNWGATGWIDTLKNAERRVIAMDPEHPDATAATFVWRPAAMPRPGRTG